MHAAKPLVALILGLLALAGPAQADTFPSRALKLVVPASPGGGSDMLARPLAARWAQELKQSIVVENRGGGGGIIGSKAIQGAAPDGYTFGLVTDAHVVAALTQKQRPYHPAKDFSAIGIVGTTPLVLMVARHTGIENLAQLLAQARAKPDGLTYGSSGIGANLHIATAKFERAAGIDLLHVPFKSGGDALQELLAGRLDMLLAAPSNAVAFRNDPRVKLIAVTSAQPIKQLPQLPTIQSAGVNYQYETFVAIIGPANIPAPIVKQLNGSLNAILRAPDLVETLDTQLVTPAPSTPEALQSKLESDVRGIEESIANGELQLAE